VARAVGVGRGRSHEGAAWHEQEAWGEGGVTREVEDRGCLQEETQTQNGAPSIWTSGFRGASGRTSGPSAPAQNALPPGARNSRLDTDQNNGAPRGGPSHGTVDSFRPAGAAIPLRCLSPAVPLRRPSSLPRPARCVASSPRSHQNLQHQTKRNARCNIRTSLLQH
jgi:hypothetical protein